MRTWSLCCCALFLAAAAYAVPSLVTPVNEAVTVVHDDTGNWGGHMSYHVTHQNAAPYQAKKVLDLSDVPAALWDQAATVRLSIFLTVHDYSWHELPAVNGLDEAFEVLVNGHSHVIRTDAGAPVYRQNTAPHPDWYDLAIPKSEVTRGVNEIIIHKAPGKIGNPEAKPDDYMYLGIDPVRKRGNSSVTFDGKTWTQEMLTIPGGNGEYMVRLYLVTGQAKVKATWQPGRTPALEDPAKLVLYAGARGVTPGPQGLQLAPGQSARVEWTATAFDMLEPLQVAVQAQGAPRLQWLSSEGKALNDPALVGLTAELPAGRPLQPSGLVITAQAQPVTIAGVTLSGSRTIHPQTPPPNIAPVVAPTPKAMPLKPQCRVDAQSATLTGGYLRAVFARGEKLTLRSFSNLLTKSDMLGRPEASPLFLVEVNNTRYAGSRDFKLTALKPAPHGFTATLEGPLPGSGSVTPPATGAVGAVTGADPTVATAAPAAPVLRATFAATITAEGLRLGMNLTNIGGAPVDFKLAFPVIAGVAVSEKPADDYYFFPSGGGIINTLPALIRRGYGDYEAMYQVMDVFSPSLFSSRRRHTRF